MFTSQRENGEDLQIIALVELDMRKMRVHIAFSRDAIRERLRELQHPSRTTTGIQAVRSVSDNQAVLNSCSRLKC
jgi:hypothetical protein